MLQEIKSFRSARRETTPTDFYQKGRLVAVFCFPFYRLVPIKNSSGHELLVSGFQNGIVKAVQDPKNAVASLGKYGHKTNSLWFVSLYVSGADG